MFKLIDTLIIKDKKLFREIEKQADEKLRDLNDYQRVKDDIFRIIKSFKDVHLVKMPIEDENITAFILNRDKKFIFINSYVPLEKQIFGAAHELYHIIYSNIIEDDLLQDAYNNIKDIEDFKANSFAACFLVPREQLKREIEIMGIDDKSIQLLDIIKLMDLFAVPYKTMVTRLYEIGFINDEIIIDKFLSIPDRKENEGVLALINKTRHAIRWQCRTNDIEYSNFIENAIDSYESGYVTKGEISDDFKYMNLNLNTFI